jgi:hypothetical protein
MLPINESVGTSVASICCKNFTCAEVFQMQAMNENRILTKNYWQLCTRRKCSTIPKQNINTIFSNYSWATSAPLNCVDWNATGLLMNNVRSVLIFLLFDGF